MDGDAFVVTPVPRQTRSTTLSAPPRLVRPEVEARGWSTEDVFSVGLLGCVLASAFAWMAFA